MNERPRDLILAMKHLYLDLLLTGRKRCEVRRTRPKGLFSGSLREGESFKLYLYFRGHIWGYVRVYGCILTQGRSIVDLARRLHEDACLSQKAMMDYLRNIRDDECCRVATPKGVIYAVMNPRRYERGVKVPCRPQSWQFLTDEIRAMLPDDGKEVRYEQAE